MTKITPYGSWRSPITSGLITSKSVGLGQFARDGQDLYWIEQRPTEAGRSVIVRRGPGGAVEDAIPAGFNARSRVHEYGGGAYVVQDGTVWFSSFKDQRVYRVSRGAAPEPVTPECAWRFADMEVDLRRSRLISVREDHTDAGKEARNTVVSFPVDGRGEMRVLAGGRDFYSAPRLSPDGRRLAWLCWDHPNMPWDGTELWLAEVHEDGSLGPARCVAGSTEESIYQPEWSPGGELYFVSDRSGWWNLHCLAGGRAVTLHPKEAEFGRPLWSFGSRTYAFESEDRILTTYTEHGLDRLGRLHVTEGKLETFDLPYTTIGGLRVAGGKAWFVGGSPTRMPALLELELGSGRATVVRGSSEVQLDEGYLSVPEALAYPSAGGRTSHALYYRPRNKDHTAPPGEKPPLIVMSHGGPTGATTGQLCLSVQYWTSRGFAVLDVNYGGSTGYGRAYRKLLEGRWGIVDVEDCAAAARHLVARGEADPERLAITGGSAGGYTTLCALAFQDTFKAGASHFGICDLEVLAKDTHKFESRYLDRLIGPYPAARETYRERSPIHHVEKFSCPIVFFQGLEDEVVPPNQARMMADALRRKGIPLAHVEFEGEQHGFRKEENVRRALDGELYFYSRIFDFELADPVEPIPIENLDNLRRGS